MQQSNYQLVDLIAYLQRSRLYNTEQDIKLPVTCKTIHTYTRSELPQLIKVNNHCWFSWVLASWVEPQYMHRQVKSETTEPSSQSPPREYCMLAFTVATKASSVARSLKLWHVDFG